MTEARKEKLNSTVTSLGIVIISSVANIWWDSPIHNKNVYYSFLFVLLHLYFSFLFSDSLIFSFWLDHLLFIYFDEKLIRSLLSLAPGAGKQCLPGAPGPRWEETGDRADEGCWCTCHPCAPTGPCLPYRQALPFSSVSLGCSVFLLISWGRWAYSFPFS